MLNFNPNQSQVAELFRCVVNLTIVACDWYLKISEVWIKFDINNTSWSVIILIWTGLSLKDTKTDFPLSITPEHQNNHVYHLEGDFITTRCQDLICAYTGQSDIKKLYKSPPTKGTAGISNILMRKSTFKVRKTIHFYTDALEVNKQ